jgi:hypothetical protein
MAKMMHLSASEAERFYNIWFPLLHFVNQHRKLVPAFPKKRSGSPVSPEVAFPVRNALWEDDALREAFIAENPAGLPPDDLALVASWKHRVADDFFIFRHLRKYTVFIDGSSPARGYGVLGITGPLEEVVPSSYLPIYVKAVLLPFENRIIYDSLLAPYPVMFGSGYKSGLNETYRDIQERSSLITRLPPDDDGESQEKVQTSNKRVLTAFQKSLGAAGLSPKMILEHAGNLEAFVSDYLNPQKRMLLNLAQDDIQAYRDLRKGSVNLVSFKRFVWFLRDSNRMDWEEAERLLDFLKRK